MTLPTQLSPRVAALLKKAHAARARLIFALDATASREPTWDMASQLQSQMFEEAAKLAGFEVQLVYFRGHDEMQASPWLADTHELITRMSAIHCAAGATQIERVLNHIQNTRERIDAVVFIGDAVEEHPQELYALAAIVNVPIFMFQEGDNYITRPNFDPSLSHFDLTRPKVEPVFREIARLTGGAYGKFDAGAAKQLGELLRAVAAFAVGGTAALANQNTDSARLLLGQLKQ